MLTATTAATTELAFGAINLIACWHPGGLVRESDAVLPHQDDWTPQLGAAFARLPEMETDS